MFALIISYYVVILLFGLFLGGRVAEGKEHYARYPVLNVEGFITLGIKHRIFLNIHKNIPFEFSSLSEDQITPTLGIVLGNYLKLGDTMGREI